MENGARQWHNGTLLRSSTTSFRLLQALVKPCLLYGSEVWKFISSLLGNIGTAETEFSRWCLRLRPEEQQNQDGSAGAGTSMEAWIQWRILSAITIATTNAKNNSERWHHTALKLHWQWAGHAANKNCRIANTQSRHDQGQKHWTRKASGPLVTITEAFQCTRNARGCELLVHSSLE